MTTMKSDVIEDFTSRLRGRLIQPHDPAYDEARKLWNAMIDRRPAMIVRCAGTADVLVSVAFARDHDLPLAIRGGGHNIAGSALCDDGLVIDLSGMRSVRIDPDQRRAVGLLGQPPGLDRQFFGAVRQFDDRSGPGRSLRFHGMQRPPSFQVEQSGTGRGRLSSALLFS